jgi:hypothetical protein
VSVAGAAVRPVTTPIEVLTGRELKYFTGTLPEFVKMFQSCNSKHSAVLCTH